jgi:Ca-activated chloride channel family protein
MNNRAQATTAICVLLLLFSGFLWIVFGCSEARHSRAGSRPDATREAEILPEVALAPPLFRAQSGLLYETKEQSPLGRSVASEELWVIQRPDVPAPPTDQDVPGCGMLRAKRPDQKKEIPLPLKHTDVDARVAGYIATVSVTQQYHNPYDEKIEAVYVFPLPQNAAVNEFVMTIGERRIRGIIREREEAEQIYAEAKRQGYVASLMTQERPNIFTQSVANIEPGKQIDLNIRYFHTLAYSDGWYEFVFPMVVGPRFNPPDQADGIGAVGRGNHGGSGQSTEVQYLKPGERSGHDISLVVAVDAGVSIEEIVCPSHVIAVNRVGPEQADIRLSALDAIPDKDFVLRYKVASRRVKSALMIQPDDEGHYFTLMIHPPETLESLPRSPMEMIFVLDCSGSMKGEPIAQAKTAIERGLKHLRPNDTFQVIQFSNRSSRFGRNPVAVSDSSVRDAIRYVRSLNGSGGTMMIEGVKAALDFPHDPRRLRVVSFMTDGFIGNEAEILAAVHDRLGASRIFSFGVGSAPNRYLLNRMARMGNGAVAYLGRNDDAGLVMDRFFERVSHPAMADLEIDWGGLDVTDVYPRRVADLFVGRPVIMTGRIRAARLASAGFEDGRAATIRITGRVGDSHQEIALPVDLGDESQAHAGIGPVWARMKIADLHDQGTWDEESDIAGQIKAVALAHNLVSDYTAFVSVDSMTRTAGSHGTTVPVAVPVPAGVRYETTVSE